MNTLRNSLRALTLALPLVGIAATWAISHQRGLKGTDWEVPVEGYDPRDLLRGHYLVFQYDWPGLEDDEVPGPGMMLCLDGEAPRIESVEVGPLGTRCPRPLRAAPGDTLLAGKLYIPQENAASLEAQLADPALRGVVRLRVRDNGRYTPVSIRFEPRPAQATPPTAEPDAGPATTP
jgi:hypothetical protein